MLSQDEFLSLIQAGGGGLYPPDAQQARAVYADPHADLFIVAGPGTGKTSCLTFRTLYLILVAGFSPKSIMATTFTRKAAAELRSRVLGWGYRIIDAGLARSLPKSKLDFLGALDLNQILTGTIDSLAEIVLREHRAAGEEPPVLADEYVTHTIMARDGLLETQLYFSKSLNDLLLNWNGGSNWGFNFSTKVGLLQAIADRRHNDLVDVGAFGRTGPSVHRKGRRRILQALEAYDAAMLEAGLLDFAQLERRMADGLRDGGYSTFTNGLNAILVDEYQDTNLLQETIYFNLAKKSGASLSVVGDDDQSLYRFRGATVELFTDFPKRLKRTTGGTSVPVFLTRNYRSTNKIVKFVAGYGRLDAKFQQVRVRDKPIIQAHRHAPNGMPILAMFRKDLETLGDDLSNLLHRVFRGNGYVVDGEKIVKGNGGDLGDAALLCFSPAEANGERLPGKLRTKLGSLNPPLRLFNPRGEDLAEIPIIRVFGGLLLECLDPGNIAAGLKISREAKDVFARWRTDAKHHLRSADRQFRQYVNGWNRCDPGRGQKWPREVPTIDLIYALRHWFPEFQNDPEQHVYFETFTRQLEAAEEVSPFGGRAIWDSDKPYLHQRSIEHLIRNFLAPIGDGSVVVNEDLIDAFPRDRLSVLSIHQSKGLEFPLVIVDVGSRFKSDHHSQARFRYPTHGELPHTLEDEMRSASPLRAPTRTPVDRAFDDLYRLFYVAFSRARDIVLLVGLEPDVPNVARGWNRAGANGWGASPPWKRI